MRTAAATPATSSLTESIALTEAAIEVHDLRRRFGAVVALDGVDLRVEPGTVHALLGANGAGKSTIIRVLATLLRPDSGSARVAGFDVTRQRREVRTHLGVVGQFPTVDNQLTGRENLRLVARLTKLPAREGRARADELLERFGLAAAADRRAGTYSGGMRRRLDLASGLVHRPRVLLLDEPTGGLDPQARHELWMLIDELVAEGATVLLTTQHLDEAERLAKAVTILHHGTVTVTGTTQDLKDRFGRTVIELTVPHIRADQAEAFTRHLQAQHLNGATRVGRDGLRIHVEDPGVAIPGIVRCLDRLGLAPASFDVRRPTLDDVMIELTGLAEATTNPTEPTTDHDGDRAGRPA